MKVQLSKEEVIALVQDHLPIPPGFRMKRAKWEKYEEFLDIEIEAISPLMSMDKPLFSSPPTPPQRPCVVDSPGNDGAFAGGSPGLGEDI